MKHTTDIILSSDTLFDIFTRQRELQRKLGNLHVVGDQAFINIMSLALIDEVLEALNETCWKPWKLRQKFDQERFKEELVDVLHFFINLCLAAGMSSAELYEKFCDKNKLNVKRKQEGY